MQETLQKMYASDNEEEIHNQILELHARYIVRLQEINDIINELKVQLKLKEFDFTKLSIH